VPDAKHFNDPAHWRDCAEEARILAEQMTDNLSRTMMLAMAADYDKLAIRASVRLDSDRRVIDLFPRSAHDQNCSDHGNGQNAHQHGTPK
jgi:hypothetical protein